MLDSWTITDADETWDFRVEVERDNRGERPGSSADAYDAAKIEKEGDPEAAQWARDAVKAWENDDWCFAVISVTPILKGSDVTFGGAVEVLGGCDWGWLPGGKDGKGTWTDNHDYARNAWIDMMIDEVKEKADDLLKKTRGT